MVKSLMMPSSRVPRRSPMVSERARARAVSSRGDGATLALAPRRASAQDGARDAHGEEEREQRRVDHRLCRVLHAEEEAHDPEDGGRRRRGGAGASSCAAPRRSACARSTCAERDETDEERDGKPARMKGALRDVPRRSRACVEALIDDRIRSGSGRTRRRTQSSPRAPADTQRKGVQPDTSLSGVAASEATSSSRREQAELVQRLGDGVRARAPRPGRAGRARPADQLAGDDRAGVGQPSFRPAGTPAASSAAATSSSLARASSGALPQVHPAVEAGIPPPHSR